MRKYFGEGFSKNVYWGLIKGHLFPWIKTIYTSYSINHLEEVKNEVDFYAITGHYLTASGKSFLRNEQNYNRSRLDSVQLIRRLFQKGYFVESNRYDDYPDFNHNAVLSDEILLKEQKLFEVRESPSKDGIINLYCDVESQVNTEFHVPIIIGYSFNGEVHQWVGETCVEDFFEHLGYRFRDSGVKCLNLWFHNVAYDIGVIGKK